MLLSTNVDFSPTDPASPRYSSSACIALRAAISGVTGRIDGLGRLEDGERPLVERRSRRR